MDIQLVALTRRKRIQEYMGRDPKILSDDQAEEAINTEETEPWTHPLQGLPNLRSLVPDQDLPSGYNKDAWILGDPLLALRALHLARIPALGPTPKSLSNAKELGTFLGSAALRKIMRSQTTEEVDLPRTFSLWLHALATSVLAEELAKIQDLISPDLCALAGLIHDLPLWPTVTPKGNHLLRRMGIHPWAEKLNLPPILHFAWQVTHAADIGRDQNKELGRILLAAEAGAILHGYPHPGQSPSEEALLEDIPWKWMEMAIRHLDEKIEARLKAIGLDLVTLRCPKQDALKFRPHPKIPPLEDGILTGLSVGSSDRIRPLLTALLPACCRYLDHDRAFFVQWVGRGKKRLLLRSRSDFISSPSKNLFVQPSPREEEALGYSAGSESTVHLLADPENPNPLLEYIGATDCLVIPVHGHGQLHGHILLDRACRAQPADPNCATKALALVGVYGQIWTSIELRKREFRSNRMAQTDALTGLLNRRAAIQLLVREMERCKRQGHPLSVLMLDLDKFKQMNDTYGHLVGDKALRAVSKVLKENLRTTDFPCRIGGEEFLIVQPDTNLDEASLAAARIFTAVEQAGKKIQLPITISIGLTNYREQDDIDSLMNRADKALYVSKEQGRNRFSVDAEG